MTTVRNIARNSLHPMFRQSIGFDHFTELFESLSDEARHSSSFPPYDIVKLIDDNYQIIMAVTGFDESDIDITLDNDQLTIASSYQQDKTEEKEKHYLHKGIAKPHFAQSFRLAEHMKVCSANMENGLLTLALLREIPEEKKLRQIAINSTLN